MAQRLPDSAAYDFQNRHLVAGSLPKEQHYVEPEKCCAYNQTRGRLLGSDVDVADFSFASLNDRTQTLTANSGAGLWLVPFRGIPLISEHIPLDLIYLDASFVIIDVVESFPTFSISKASPPAASVLALPDVSTEARFRPDFSDAPVVCSGNVWDIGLGDINGNGSTDAVLSGNPTRKILTSLLNKGNGTFSLASNPFTDVEDDGFAVGNYNSGGKADVATIVTNSNELQVLFGKGNGEFGSPATYHTGSNPVSIGKRDLNGDGYADLVVANSGDNTVSVFLGTAAGKFGPGKQYAAGKSPKQVAFGDFNRDGKVDLAVADATSISILLYTAS
jgi:hypothetical protein